MPRLLRALSKGTVIPLAVIFVVALSLAACGSNGGSTNKNLEIATLFATTSVDASAQLPAQYAAQLAVQQAKLPNGYKLTLVPENYESASGSGPDTTVAATEAHQLVSNASILGIIGPFNSGVAEAVMPITQPAGLTMISPANTNPGLTIEQYAQPNGMTWSQIHPSGSPDSYFRIPGNDVVQGKVDAQVASSAPISAKTAFVVDDDTAYGIGLANYFTQSFTADGGKTVGSLQAITSAEVSNLAPLASTIVAANPDIVFYGGVTSGGGGALKKDLVADHFTKPMVGGDGIAEDSGFLTTAGSAAGNTWGTVAAPDNSTLTSSAATTFVNDYNQFASSKQDGTIGAYSAMTYDATNIMIQAITSAINSGKAVTRAAVREAVAATNYSGVTGQISFDSNGDNSGPKVFSVYEVDPTTLKWVFKSAVNG